MKNRWIYRKIKWMHLTTLFIKKIGIYERCYKINIKIKRKKIGWENNLVVGLSLLTHKPLFIS